MRRLLALIALAVPLHQAAAQSVTVDNGRLVSEAGVVDLNGHTLDVGPLGSLDETGGRVTTTDPGMLIAPTQNLDAPTGAEPGGLGLTLTSTNSLGDVSVSRGHDAQSSDGNTGIERYYDVTATVNTGLDATLVFEYDEDELNGIAEADLVLFRSTDGGTTWQLMGGTVDTGANTITLAGVDELSLWTAASSAAPLPVELVTFEGRADGFDAVLRWTTTSETNNAGFEVQAIMSPESRAWETLGFIEGRGTTAEAQQYTYRAAGLSPGTHLFRLKQVDFDGTFAYGPEVEVVVGVPGTHLLSPAYPNPFNPQTSFMLAVQVAQRVRLAVYDALGRQVALLHDGALEAGRAYRFTFDGAGMASGLYLLRAEGDVFHETRSLVLLK